MILCFDIGGTAIKIAEASPDRPIRMIGRHPTPTRDFDAFLEVLRRAVAGASTPPGGLAFALAGIVDRDGRAIVANIPCLNGRTLRAEFEETLGLPVVIANDADCFALAEATDGAGRGHGVVFGVILGTGIGGGIVAGGRLINGGAGFAGEWGHGPVVGTCHGATRLPVLRCGCGQTGCLDSFASARGMERIDAHLNGAARSAEEIVTAWDAGETAATRTVVLWRDILAGPLAMVINLLGAGIVPVGGGLSNSVRLVAELDAAVRARCLLPPADPLIVPARCRMEPGLIGAAALGRSVGF